VGIDCTKPIPPPKWRPPDLLDVWTFGSLGMLYGTVGVEMIDQLSPGVGKWLVVLPLTALVACLWLIQRKSERLRQAEAEAKLAGEYSDRMRDEVRRVMIMVGSRKIRVDDEKLKFDGPRDV
jgi:hypothetical protein